MFRSHHDEKRFPQGHRRGGAASGLARRVLARGAFAKLARLKAGTASAAFRTGALAISPRCIGAALGIASILAVAGCQALPGEGPSATAILSVAGESAAEQNRANASVFDVIEVDAKSARLVADYSGRVLDKQFGLGSASRGAVFGVGDRVRITIFEAGENGLFSTVESKQTNLELVVQPDGKIQVPYSGAVRFAGRTAEQVRGSILASLRGKAVEPDVIISTLGTGSRVVSVSGSVRNGAEVPLNLNGDRIMDVIAKAGGPSTQPYETYVTLTRGSRTATVLMSEILRDPRENIYVQPDDQVFVTFDPQTFTILGQTARNSRIPFGASDLNLLEAVALGGGGRDETVNAKGYFVFRYENPSVVELLLGPQRFAQLKNKGMEPNRFGEYPIVYRFDMTRPDSLIAGQTFPIKHRDVIYASRHPAVDLQRFLTLVGQPLAIARTGQIIAQQN